MNHPDPYLRYRCPVCWQNVEPTVRQHISLHFDSLGLDVCPTTGEPFFIAQPWTENVFVIKPSRGARRHGHTAITKWGVPA